MKNGGLGHAVCSLRMRGIPLKFVTLQIHRSSEKTFSLTLILLIFLVGTAEWVARSEPFQTPLTPPRMGSRHYQLGHKLALLDRLIRKTGRVDCIMLGNSMVETGIEPESFQTGYKKMTGRDINCFSFGIDASSATSTAALVMIIVEDYHPRLLISGTDLRDYAVGREDPDPAVV